MSIEPDDLPGLEYLNWDADKCAAYLQRDLPYFLWQNFFRRMHPNETNLVTICQCVANAIHKLWFEAESSNRRSGSIMEQQGTRTSWASISQTHPDHRRKVDSDRTPYKVRFSLQ